MVTELPQTSEPIPNVADKAVYEEWDNIVERADTTAASLDVEHASDNINRTQSTAMPNVPPPQRIGAGGSPRCQEAIGGSIAQTRSERVPTPSYDSPLLGFHTLESDEEIFKQHELTSNVQQQSNDPPISRGHTFRSGEENIELIKELMETCTKLSEQVLALEESKTAQDLVITRLKLRVKKLEKKKKKARTPQHMKRRLFKVRDQGRFSAQGEAYSQEDQLEDQLGVFSAAKVLVDAARKNVQTYTRRRRAVSTGSGGISTASRLFSTVEESVSTAGASMPVRTAGSKRQKTNEALGSVQEQPDEEENELSQEDLQQMMMVVPVKEVYVEALYVKYPIIDWEVYTEESRKYWKIIRVERFSSTEATDDKERTLWVELKRLFEPDTDDTLWKLQRYMHDPLTWRLCDTCGVHHVFTDKGMDIFMLVEKEYPLSKGVLTLMLVNKLLVGQHSEMACSFMLCDL
nr:hypothetical protein [Tanacetum cinerariifolium]